MIVNVSPPVEPFGVVTVRKRIPGSVLGSMFTKTAIVVVESDDGAVSRGSAVTPGSRRDSALEIPAAFEMVIPGPLIASCVWRGTKLAPVTVTRTLEPAVAVFGSTFLTIGGGPETVNFWLPEVPWLVVTTTS